MQRMTNKGNTSGLCARLYVNNTKLTASGSHMSLCFIRSIPDFTDPILKAKNVHLGLLNLGRVLVNEEETKTKEKGSSCIQLFVQLEFAFENSVTTGCILGESIPISLF